MTDLATSSSAFQSDLLVAQPALRARVVAPSHSPLATNSARSSALFGISIPAPTARMQIKWLLSPCSTMNTGSIEKTLVENRLFVEYQFVGR